MSKITLPLRFLCLSLLLVAVSVLSLVCGAQRGVLRSALGGDALSRVILADIRLPRTLLALTAGAMLGGAGAVSQMYFQNPIAEPGVMGLTAGATLGAVIAAAGRDCFAMSRFATNLNVAGRAASCTVNIGAFCGALLTGLFLLAVLGALRSSPVAIILCGAAVGTFLSAVTAVLLLVHSDTLRTMFVWTLGSFSGRGWPELRIIAVPVIASLCLMRRVSDALDLSAGGQVTAAALGVDVGRVAALVLVTLSLSVSAAVCAGGTIGFVGLIAPHAARAFFPPRARVSAAASALCGAVLLTASDAAARTAASPAELPVGVVMSLAGAPFFVYLMIKAARGHKI